MSESLPVELNGESVHAVEAPETFTASGPFHIELRNDGGAVHVHVHLDDTLSEAVHLRNVNHYVEGGETARVAVGITGDSEVTGAVEIVSGYGAERERVEITIEPSSNGGHTARRPGGGRGDAGPSGGGSDPSGRDQPVIEPSSRGDGSGVSAETTRSSRRHSAEQSTTGSAHGRLPRGAALRSTLPNPGGNEVAFVALAAVAAAVGIAVILVVREPLLSLVVALVVTAAVVVAGWLLFG